MPDSFQPDSFAADAKPQPQLRSRTGALYTPPADSGIKDFGQGAADAATAAVNPQTYLSVLRNALNDPVGAAGDLLLSPVRMLGGLVTQPAYTLGNLAAGAAMGGAVGGAKAAGKSAIRGAAAAGDAISPDVVGIISPRAGKALEVAQKLRDKIAPPSATPSAAPVETPSAAPPAAAAPAAAPSTPPPPPAPAQAPTRATAAAKNLKLSAEEFQAFRKLVDEGYDSADVLTAIQKNRLPAAWQNLPSDAEVAAAVKDRNTKGRWPQDKF